MTETIGIWCGEGELYADVRPAPLEENQLTLLSPARVAYEKRVRERVWPARGMQHHFAYKLVNT